MVLGWSSVLHCVDGVADVGVLGDLPGVVPGRVDHTNGLQD